MAFGDEMENGIIEYTTLGVDPVPHLTIGIRFDGSQQGYQVTLGTDNAYTAIFSILQALEIDVWERLPGKSCRVKRVNRLIDVIGHIYKDQWSKRIDA